MREYVERRGREDKCDEDVSVDLSSLHLFAWSFPCASSFCVLVCTCAAWCVVLAFGVIARAVCVWRLAVLAVVLWGFCFLLSTSAVSWPTR